MRAAMARRGPGLATPGRAEAKAAHAPHSASDPSRGADLVLLEEGGLRHPLEALLWRLMSVTDKPGFMMKPIIPVTCHRCSREIDAIIVWRKCWCERETNRHDFLGGRQHRWPCRNRFQAFCATCEPPDADYTRGFCRRCGRLFAQKGTPRKYCSDECGRAMLYDSRRKRRADNSCALCGLELKPGRSDSCYCSSACRQAAYRARRKETQAEGEAA